MAYSQTYYQTYYQSYYQTYYQSYYQSGYGTTFTSDVTVTGDAYVTGAVSKVSGTFVIDHPLDPENMLLYHSFVESPDVKNLYDGIAVLDASGEATVVLPDYFEVLNKDFRYQVKSMSEPGPNLHIKNEISDNSFDIAGGPPNAQVSWQVTGIRQDPYILANPIIPEVEKGPEALMNKGEYLYEGYGPLADITFDDVVIVDAAPGVQLGEKLENEDIVVVEKKTSAFTQKISAWWKMFISFLERL